MRITQARVEFRAYSDLYVGLALLMACALFCTPMIVNTLSSEAAIAKFGKEPLPGGEEEEVKEAKPMPSNTGSKLAVHVLDQGVTVPHGTCALLSVKHCDVPDPPPWG